MNYDRHDSVASRVAVCFAVLLLLSGCQPEDRIAPRTETSASARHQAELDELDGVVTIRHSLTLGRDRLDPTDPIVDLRPLRALETVSGSVYIKDLDEVTTLEPLSSLRSIGLTFHIGGNDGITTLAPLSNLRDFGNNFVVQYNSRLKSLVGLEGATDLGSTSVLFVGNDSLESLHGLEGLKSHGDGPGRGFATRFIIANNRRLSSLRGLENLRSVGALSIRNAPLLDDLDDLAGLEVAGSISFASNSGLCESEIQAWAKTIEIHGAVVTFKNAVCLER